MLLEIIVLWCITYTLAPYTCVGGLQTSHNKCKLFQPELTSLSSYLLTRNSSFSTKCQSRFNNRCFPLNYPSFFLSPNRATYLSHDKLDTSNFKLLFPNFSTFIRELTQDHSSKKKILLGAHVISETPVLDSIKYPSDLRKISLEKLKTLAHELRWDVINKVAKTGGHLSASLGVIELTIALHYVFQTPEDRLIWDVSHQAYAHKILTGRRQQMDTVRKKHGLSGFTNRKESIYDPFGAGHSSTSISAAQGMSAAQGLLDKKSTKFIAVIGDGGITGGMAFEAINYVGHLRSNMIVILNDNEQVSLPTGSASAGGTGPSGALSSYMAKLLTSRGFQNVRNVAKRFSKLFPEYIREKAAQIDEYSRGIITGNTLFEEFGFYYVGPVDGHDIENLIAILKNIKNSAENRPILLHIKTHKGFGYDPAMKAKDKMHGVLGFDIATGDLVQTKSNNPALTQTFSRALSEIALHDHKVVAVTAAMPGGTGLTEFGKLFPNRTFDVGIAEQHAVTFAGGLACEGLKPFCCIYSTFLQRAYDQIIHDICLQGLPVRFIIDRAGLVGPDGATHQGAYDLTYLGTIPGIIIMSPSDEVELTHMVETAYQLELPSAIRFPRMTGYGLNFLNEYFGYNLESLPIRGKPLKVGKGRLIRNPTHQRPRKVAILSLGTRLAESIKAARQIETERTDVHVTVADARFMKPIDEDLITNLAENHEILITIEEGSIGGFGSHVSNYLFSQDLFEKKKLKFRSIHLPDRFIEHSSQEQQYEETSLNSHHITKKIQNLLKF